MSTSETSEPGPVRSMLFDLAVNRAFIYLRSTHTLLKLGDSTSASHLDLLEQQLAPWHARTRFAARLSLRAISQAVAEHPGACLWHWTGGMHGSWQPGRAQTP